MSSHSSGKGHHHHHHGIWYRMRRWMRHNKKFAAAAALLCIVVLSAGGFFLLHSQKEQKLCSNRLHRILVLVMNTWYVWANCTQQNSFQASWSDRVIKKSRFHFESGIFFYIRKIRRRMLGSGREVNQISWKSRKGMVFWNRNAGQKGTR